MRKVKKKKMMNLLLEYLKDSKRSDRKIAKVLGVSQPTVTRRRQALVKEGWIKDFTVIPDFVKMGYELMVITIGRYKVPRTPELLEKGLQWMNKYPNIIFASRARGMGKDAVMISLHKSFTDYSNFLNDLMSELGDYIKDNDSLIIALKELPVKPLSLKYLGEQQET